MGKKGEHLECIMRHRNYKNVRLNSYDWLRYFNQGDKETGKKGQFVTLKAFGPTAEFIERNVNSKLFRIFYPF